MNDILVTRAMWSHTEKLAPFVGAAAADELQAAHGHSPLEALQRSFRLSVEAHSVLCGEDVVAMFGVAHHSPGIGSVWLIASEWVERHPLLALRISRREVRALQERWPILVNAIDARYTTALRWAKWLGCELREPVTFGVGRRPFHPFVLRSPIYV